MALRLIFSCGNRFFTTIFQLRQQILNNRLSGEFPPNGNLENPFSGPLPQSLTRLSRLEWELFNKT